MSENILEKFQPEESRRLEDAFRERHHPDMLSMSFLAAEIGLPNEQVEVREIFTSISIFRFTYFSLCCREKIDHDFQLSSFQFFVSLCCRETKIDNEK